MQYACLIIWIITQELRSSRFEQPINTNIQSTNLQRYSQSTLVGYNALNFSHEWKPLIEVECIDYNYDTSDIG